MVYSGLITKLVGTTKGSAIATYSVLLIGIIEDHSARRSGNANLTNKILATGDKIHGVENKMSKPA